MEPKIRLNKFLIKNRWGLCDWEASVDQFNRGVDRVNLWVRDVVIEIGGKNPAEAVSKISYSFVYPRTAIIFAVLLGKKRKQL